MLNELNKIFINPEAYRVFPNIGNPNNHSVYEKAIYSGYLNVVIDGKVVKQFTNNSTIYLGEFSGQKAVQIDNVTEYGSVVLGRWDLMKFIDKYVKEATVLWYDISRQGATNDSMKTNPILKDLSGNGHDATCYNFAWSGMSGVGGYSENYNSYTYYSNRAVITRSSDGGAMNITKTITTNSFLEVGPSAGNINGYQVSITGINEVDISIEYRNDNHVLITMSSDGIYTIPEVEDGNYVGFSATGIVDSCNITIEQLPLYSNALVSDGVDDYMSDIEVNKDLSSFIIQIEGIEGGSPTGGYQVPVFICTDRIGDISIWRNSNAITYLNEINSKDLVMSLWNDNSIGKISNALSGKTVVYGDWDNSKPKRTMIANNETISDTIRNEHSLYTFFRDINSASYKKAALYSFILFNRTLTTDEIEWVKTNLIEGDTEL